MQKGGKIYFGIGVMIPILAFIWLASMYTEELGYYCLEFGSCTTMYVILYVSIPIGFVFCVRAFYLFEKPKTKKIVRYSILSGFFWALPVLYSGTRPPFLIEPTTGFILVILSIIGLVFMILALRNFATRKELTKKEKSFLEKEDLKKRIRKLEEKSKSTQSKDHTQFWVCPICGNDTKEYYGRSYCHNCKRYL